MKAPVLPSSVKPGIVMRETFFIPIKGLSVNDAFKSVRGRRAKSKAYREWVDEFHHKIGSVRSRKVGLEIKKILDQLPEHAQLYVSYTFCEEWMCRGEHRPKVKDVSNMIKTVEDQFHKALGVDDKWVFSLRILKKHSRDESEHGIAIDLIVYIAEFPANYSR